LIGARHAAAAIGDTDVAELSRAADDARYQARKAADDADRFAARVKAIRKLQETADRLERTHAALADLSAALKPGAFPKWLTLRRSRDLLVHASRVLADMTGGRYAFADLTDDSSDWLVVDNDNGMARSPASLSGGEKFVASLALALGMVEMMARSGGRLDALFLDEGFGALDRDNLDAAVEALAAAASSGRMVASISHVRAVAEQVAHVLSVTREPTGTAVRWLDDAERRALALDDVTGDAAVHRLLS
jgi:exonuclease SbcC